MALAHAAGAAILVARGSPEFARGQGTDGASDAGSPIAMQGELYINLGLAGVVLGALVLGAIAGAVARFTLLKAAGGAALVLNSITILWMYTFLRDGFANAFSNLVMAFMGAGLAVYVLGTTRDLAAGAAPRPPAPRMARRPARRRRRHPMRLRAALLCCAGALTLVAFGCGGDGELEPVDPADVSDAEQLVTGEDIRRARPSAAC